ncbi:hypothetical protein A1OK_10845 [Enterovibrio norvegicus FF-454]|uniref:Bacteriophage T5 Orf172 DNA-binding domain-containing protein n=1 Tax=Enterovibrio norvegicus FF-454 TaxID=1185651 RepID=A0A1E5C4M1_9GAMM|nr:GIY-YIG nuclease family protein [Enterovibrio norvegicus]OEE60440.1 hypothetical protein A1OK_10845 [Enterovibrio norvegicus FF-454]
MERKTIEKPDNNHLFFEAKKKNLTFLKKIDKDHSEYRFPCGCIQVRQMSSVRNKHTPYESCSDCSSKKVSLKYSDEARNIGLKLLSKTRSRRTRHYLLKCGHIEEKTVKQVREDGVRCNQCILDGYINYGKSQGITPIKHIKGGDYWLWKFNDCGHFRLIQPMNVKHGDVVCKECFDEKTKREALSVGLELIFDESSKPYNANYRRYIVTACGHKQTFTLSSVRKNSWRCKSCLREKLSIEASKVRIDISGRSKKKGCMEYKFKDCGHKKDIHTTQVRNSKSINCSKCKNSAWERSSEIYLIKIEAKNRKWLKLGHTENIEKRCLQYGIPRDSKVSILYRSTLDSRVIAQKIEKLTHDKFSNYNLNHSEMNELHTKSGFTECYPVKITLEMMRFIEIEIVKCIFIQSN